MAAIAGKTPPPVIVLASRESGGTALSAMLGAHPEFCAAPHLNVLAFEAFWQLSEYSRGPRGTNLHGLHRFVAECLTGEQTVQSVKAATRWLARRTETPAVDLYRQLAATVAPRRIVDFSPLYGQGRAVVDRVVAAVPDATFIHLVRHPCAQGRALSRAVWHSLKASLDHYSDVGFQQPCVDVIEVGEQYIDWSVTPAVFDTQFAWFRTQNVVRAATEHLPDERHLRVRYEDLVAAPQATLAHVLERLGADATPDRIERMLAPSVPVFGRPGPYSAPCGVDYEVIGKTLASLFPGDVAPEPAIDPRAELLWRGDAEPMLPEVASLARQMGYEVLSLI